MPTVLEQQVVESEDLPSIQVVEDSRRAPVTSRPEEESRRVRGASEDADFSAASQAQNDEQQPLQAVQKPSAIERQPSGSSDAGSPCATTEATSGGGDSACGSTGSHSPWQLGVLRDGMASDKGGRMYMEDRQVAVLDLKEHLSGDATYDMPDRQAFFGVFDGHNGECAAQFAAENLLPTILAHASFPEDMGGALAAGFVKTDMAYEACLESEGSGSTALSVIVWGRDMTIANLGDCRAVISRRGRALDLSRDQKPSTDSERKRIIAAGGSVCPEGFLNGVLGVSRAIGNWNVRGQNDILLKRRIQTDPKDSGSLHATCGPLISVPEISTHRLGPDDEFMVLATDGLWDVFSSQRCIEVARMMLQENNDPQLCAEGLIQRALDMHTTDNVSAQIICFGADPPPSRRPSAFSGRRNLSVDSLSVLRTALGCAETTPTGAGLAAPSPLSSGSTRWESIG
eukprot:CAMPEP_0117655184 /NCGR_PEP_ID=MMETSP0804-20121206/4145_1 /TAXON_ID=1074897 /ORGANISM="Tetraselmis astigmatica, Strain CCMP880" /LENGTH=456 /DNA_ID=CAMNT_0005461521 /DNA_START=390 /DNA_END=1760 /DNA_ORIENTATION=+